MSLEKHPIDTLSCFEYPGQHHLATDLCLLIFYRRGLSISGAACLSACLPVLQWAYKDDIHCASSQPCRTGLSISSLVDSNKMSFSEIFFQNSLFVTNQVWHIYHMVLFDAHRTWYLKEIKILFDWQLILNKSGYCYTIYHIFQDWLFQINKEII